MISQIVPQENARATLTLTIFASAVNMTFAKVYKNIVKQINIPNYQQSKVPKEVVLQQIGGKQVLQKEVRNALVNYYYPKALKEHKLNPIAAQVSNEQPWENKDYSFSVELELYPKVVLPNINQITIETEVEQVTNAVLSQEIEHLREQNVIYAPVGNGQVAQNNDLIYFTWLDDPHETILPVYLFTAPVEITKQIIGRKITEVFEVSFFPQFLEEESSLAYLLGDVLNLNIAQEVKLELIVKDIKTWLLPEPNEDFAKTLGFSSWAETEKNLRNNLQMDFDKEGLEAQMDELLAKLIASTNFHVPSIFIEQHKKFLLEDIAKGLAEEGKDLQQYFEGLKKANEYKNFENNIEEEAKEQAKRDLVLEALVKQCNTTITQEEFDSGLLRLARNNNQTLLEFKTKQSKEWLNSYYFVLVQEKALRTSVQELVK